MGTKIIGIERCNSKYGSANLILNLPKFVRILPRIIPRSRAQLMAKIF
jgi:hypothetical protein